MVHAPILEAAILEDRAAIALRGAEARDFLQGLITNDIASCTAGHAIWAALLTPQGKILFDFLIAADGETDLLLDCAAARSPDLLKRLILYRLRAKVEIAVRRDFAVAAFWGDGAAGVDAGGPVAFPDPRLAALGLRAIGTHAALTAAVRNAKGGDYQAHRLALGVPDSADLPPDSVFALDAGMEELNGVNFKKGCYVGQEVTSRMKHRATARRRFVIADFEGDAPPAGTPVESEGRALGETASAQGGRGLALVRLDRLAEAEEKGAPIIAGGKAVRLSKPDWLKV